MRKAPMCATILLAWTLWFQDTTLNAALDEAEWTRQRSLADLAACHAAVAETSAAANRTGFRTVVNAALDGGGRIAGEGSTLAFYDKAGKRVGGINMVCLHESVDPRAPKR